MAVEINELVIRAVAVNDDVSDASTGNNPADPQVFQALVTACVDEMKKILERKANR